VTSEPLPEFRLKARNTSAASENKIHDDAVARQLGFAAALVPGVTVYAYLTRPLAAGLGRAWLERGTASVRFLRPLHDGDEVVVGGAVTARGPRGIEATVRAATAAAPECAVATATVPAGLPTPVNLALYPAAPLPDERPPASRERLGALAALGSPVTTWDAATAAAYLEQVEDPLPRNAGVDGFVHPAVYLQQANRALSLNVRLGPWIHAASTVRHLGGARVGETLTTRGRVRSLFEKKGRQYVELDLVVVAAPARPVAHVLHTAIYALPAPAAPC
jgi:acyl-coenzyme A thioesterase PaaI-like protein